MREALTYDDVLLVPQYSDIRTRKEVDISNRLQKNIQLDLPIIAAPMDTVTESEMAYAMAKEGGLGIIHRYNAPHEQLGLVRELHDSLLSEGHTNPNIAIAVGVTDKYLTRAAAAWENGANIICVDVAHGHHSMVKEALGRLKIELEGKVHIMAGNVATLEGFNALSEWGADSVRCNIGGGSICSTRIQTGHGLPGLHTIMECAKSKFRYQTKIIADGGIRSSGDMVKALAAGADFVMVGSLLAGTDEAPGEKITTASGRIVKSYRGMASKAAQMEWRSRVGSDEGISTMVDYKGHAGTILKSLRNGIKSGLSYSGCRNIREFQENAIFVKQTTAGLRESRTHILTR